MDDGGAAADAMMRGNRALVRRLRKAAKLEAMSRPGMRWRGWGISIFQRSSGPSVRLIIPAFLLLTVMMGAEVHGLMLTLFAVWTIVSVVLQASVTQYQLRNPTFLAFYYVLPVEDRVIHRDIAGGWWRGVMPNAWDWFLLFGAAWFHGGSWTVMSVFAVFAGAVLMAATVLVLGVGLVLLLPERINWSVAFFVVMGISIGGLLIHSRVDPQWMASLMSFLEATPIWIIAERTLSVIQGESADVAWMGIALIALVSAFWFLWRISAARFDIAKQLGEAPSDDEPAVKLPEAVPATVSREAVRIELARELARPPGAATGDRGLMERCLVKVATRKTRERLDLLHPTGFSWGWAWWVAAAGVLAALVVAFQWPTVPVHYLLLLFWFSIPVSGGQWDLMQERTVGPVSMHGWVPLPIRAMDLARTMLWANHLRLALVLPLFVMMLWSLFPDKPILDVSLRSIVLLVAALPLASLFQFIAGVTILGPKGKVSTPRISIVVVIVLTVIFLFFMILFANPLRAGIAALVLLIGAHALHGSCLRRIDAGKYDFL